MDAQVWDIFDGLSKRRADAAHAGDEGCSDWTGGMRKRRLRLAFAAER
jgi:hypothetical protein